MKCMNCGFEAQENFDFCPNCGRQTAVAEPVSLNPAADGILFALKDKLFLLICIFMSAATVFSLAEGTVNIINILLCVFLWLVYAGACKGEADVAHLRNVSGTVYAYYVIVYVVCGILLVVGGLCAFLFAGNNMFAEIFEEIVFETGLGQDIINIVSGISGAIIFIVFAIIAIIGIAINALAIGKIHRFAKSVYMSADCGELRLEKVSAAKNWLLAFGIISIISAGNGLLNGVFVSAVASGAVGVAEILSSVLIGKYLSDEY